ncbi:MAG TPA: ParA family protein [Caldilineae bacterium]|nr:ParA family protein [Caldilineae bacterium]HIQ12235.1 ParA family protein [Caldilineales bacterium]
MTRIYAIANQKGGVGKTTTAVNLGAYLAAAGQRVLIVDIDPQANATSSLGLGASQLPRSIYDVFSGETELADVITLTNRMRLDIVPSSHAMAALETEAVETIRDPYQRSFLLRNALTPTLHRYDYILIDSPPSLGLITVNAMTAAQGVLIPVQSEYLALEGLGQLLSTIDKVRRGLNPALRIVGILVTMADMRNKLSRQVEEEIRKYFQDLVFKTVIPRNVRLGESPSYGEPINAYAPNSAGARAYQQLAEELLIRDGVMSPTSPQGAVA